MFGMEAAIIVNPRARGVRRRYWKNINKLESLGFELIVTSSLDDLIRKVDEIKERDLSHIGIFGGDGTLFHTLNALLKLEKLPTLFYLPGGTFNTIGKNLGFTGDPFAIAGKIAGNIYEKRQVATLSIEFDNANKIGFIFSSGLPYRSMEQYYSGGEPTFWTGLKTALWPLVSFFFPFLVGKDNYFDPPQMKVIIDGKLLWEGPTLTVTAATVKNLGLWISPFSDECEGFYTLASSAPLGLIMRNFFKVLTGNFSHPLHYSRRSKVVEVELPEGFLIDGEMFPVEGRKGIRIMEGPLVEMTIPES